MKEKYTVVQIFYVSSKEIMMKFFLYISSTILDREFAFFPGLVVEIVTNIGGIYRTRANGSKGQHQKKVAILFAALTVRTCLEILGALDAARHDQPRCIEKIYNLIFNGSQKEKFEVSAFCRNVLFCNVAFNLFSDVYGASFDSLLPIRLCIVFFRSHDCFVTMKLFWY